MGPADTVATGPVHAVEPGRGAGASGAGTSGAGAREPDRPTPMTDRGRGRGLTVLAGPTAVGKGTVVACLRQRYPQVWVSVSVTTRRPRPGETDGVHYRFVDDDAFDRLVAEEALLEYAVVHGAARYGTPRAPVLEAVSRGRPALLEIDLQGARMVRAAMPGARFVFLAPPSFDALVDRLAGRATETLPERERRLATARDELAAEREFDATVVNDSVEAACDAVAALMGLAPAA